MVVLALPRQDFIDQAHRMDGIEMGEHQDARLFPRMASAGLGFQDITKAVAARHANNCSP